MSMICGTIWKEFIKEELAYNKIEFHGDLDDLCEAVLNEVLDDYGVQMVITGRVKRYVEEGKSQSE